MTETKVEYAVICQRGDVHPGWRTDCGADYALGALSTIAATGYNCGPHRVMQRRVGGWRRIAPLAPSSADFPLGVE